MSRNLLVMVVVILVTSMSHSQTVFHQWVDIQGGQVSYTTGVVLPELEIWALCWNTYPDLSIGRLVPIHEGKKSLCLMGGYVDIWPKTGDVFITPTIAGEQAIGDGKLAGCLYWYLPLSQGQRPIVFIDEASLTYPVGKNLEAGLAATCLKQGGYPGCFKWGAKARWQMSKDVFVGARYLPLGGGAPDTSRIEVGMNF